LGTGHGELREETLPPVQEGDVLVESVYGAISRGTETLVFQGRVPAAEFERMRCPHQAGEWPGPVKYGYCNVGRVVQGPPALLGRLVFCLYPHQTQYVVAAQAVVPVPDEVPPERAVLAANLETAVNALWDACPQLGDKVTIVGAGTLGCLTAYLAARVPGVEVQLVDSNDGRRALAAALGASFARPDGAERERDLVIHASASEAGLRTAFGLCASEGTVLELSWYGDRAVVLELGGAFHSRRLGLRASQVGTVSPRARSHWTHRKRLELALRLCADPALERLVTEEGRFETLPQTLERLSRPDADVLCHRVVYGRRDGAQSAR
ncbi:MAG TPA: zinc-binding alcohol dehydrogenase, partial [Polyangiaceae bacterium]